MSFMPLDAPAQDSLLNDVRDRIAEYAQCVNMPLAPVVLADAAVAIVSEKALQFIATLEGLLDEAAAETDDESFSERIGRALR